MPHDEPSHAIPLRKIEVVQRSGAARVVLSVDPPRAILAGDAFGEVQDYFLTFDALTIDLRDGVVKARYHYEPDYDTNLGLGEKLIPPGSTSGAPSIIT